MMDIGLAFSFPFQDPDWVKKIAIAAVLNLIPLVGQIAVLGWTILLAKRVIAGEEHPMPDWDEAAEIFTAGLKAFVIGFLYALPVLVIMFPASLLGMFDNSGDSISIFEIGMICLSCLIALYGLLISFLWPAAAGELAATDDLGTALNPGRILRLFRAAPGAYIIVFLGIMAAGIVASFGVVLCFVGVLFTGAYAYAVQGHLIGQAYKQASASAA
ncbi:MAG: DUF4013 domain-containing protein [Anaerolineales bacterium]|jgi:hypothetical protein